LPSALTDVRALLPRGASIDAQTTSSSYCLSRHSNTSSPREESNFHDAVYGTGALPLCYEGELVGRVGFEPTFFLGKNQVQSSFAIDP
jgi:hypothetical protein